MCLSFGIHVQCGFKKMHNKLQRYTKCRSHNTSLFKFMLLLKQLFLEHINQNLHIQLQLHPPLKRHLNLKPILLLPPQLHMVPIISLMHLPPLPTSPQPKLCVPGPIFPKLKWSLHIGL